MHDELTKVDIKKMQEEIEYRRNVLAPTLREEVRQARELGDLSENFEYHAARREMNKNIGRINYLQRMIDTAIVIEPTVATSFPTLMVRLCALPCSRSLPERMQM